MALASTDPETGEPRPVNTVSQPSSNAEFLANQLQSNGHFQLEDGQALVLKIDPGRAPTTSSFRPMTSGRSPTTTGTSRPA